MELPSWGPRPNDLGLSSDPRHPMVTSSSYHAQRDLLIGSPAGGAGGLARHARGGPSRGHRIARCQIATSAPGALRPIGTDVNRVNHDRSSRRRFGSRRGRPPTPTRSPDAHAPTSHRHDLRTLQLRQERAASISRSNIDVCDIVEYLIMTHPDQPFVKRQVGGPCCRFPSKGSHRSTTVSARGY